MEKFRELSFEESQEIDGGYAPLAWKAVKYLAVAIVGTAVSELMQDGWDACVNDFKNGYNEVRN